jgi:DNA-binding GntR family transcriptional regulator
MQRLTGSADAIATDPRRFAPITNRTLVDTVVETLRESILSGRFAPGERLVEAELARELAISRGPIREALALLEKDGIVVNLPRRGKFTTAFDVRTIDEIYSLRKVIEPYAVELIIASLSDAKRDALLESVAELRQAADAGDVLVLAERDIAFHNRLYDLAEHELLRKVWTEAMAGKLRMLLNVTVRTHQPTSTAENHRVIVDAMLDKNVRRSRALIADHIDDAWRRAKAALEHAGSVVPV